MSSIIEQVKMIIDEELKAIDLSKGKSKLDPTYQRKKFNLRSLSKKVLPILIQESKIFTIYSLLSKVLTEKQIQMSLISIFRFSFFIQIVREKGGAANYTQRWSEHFGIPDPRYSTYEDCIKIFTNILNDLFSILSIDKHRLNFIHLQGWANFYWIDYQQKNLNIHNVNNISILSFDDRQLLLKMFKLEHFLLNPDKNPHYYILFKEIYNKVRTKAYLTDRSQTGGYQTNREYRWEAHPESVEFAFVKDCQEIEYKLVTQILEFKGFPIDIIESLEEEEVITKGEITPEACRCPITMEHLLFTDFQDELLNRTHGESKFQVGHIVPRKTKIINEIQIQSSENICWISSEGNEIQQNRSVYETRNLLKRIFKNYKNNNLL